MRRLALTKILFAAAVLLAAGGAEAKAPAAGLDLCGASSCVHLAWQQVEPIWIGARRPMTPPPPSSFYLLRWKWSSGGAEQRGYYVPAALALRMPSGSGETVAWWRLDPATALAIERAAVSLVPHETPTPTAVTVGKKEARGPETYLRLLSGSPVSWTPAKIWVNVTMRTAVPSPWTDEFSEIRISARGLSRFVSLSGSVMKVPWLIANRARRGLPLSP